MGRCWRLRGKEALQLWQVADGSLLHTLETERPVNSAVFSPDGALLASTGVIDAHAGAIRGGVWLWRVSDWQQLNVLDGHSDWLESVAFPPDGAPPASAGGPDDRKVRL